MVNYMAVNRSILCVALILYPEMMFFPGFYGYSVFGGIAAFYTEHFFESVFTQVAHFTGGFLPRVPDDGGMAVAFDDDDIAFQGFVFYYAVTCSVEVYPVNFFVNGYRAMLVFAFEVVEFVEVAGIVQTVQ